jgi:phospholipase/carboxylesterase
MQWEKYKKLDFVCETQESSEACVVLFHGYGADANDLASLNKIFKFKQPVDWFFPQGMHKVDIGSMMTGRAWFELRASDLEKISTQTLMKDGINPEIKKVLEQVTEWLNHLGKLYKQVFIGGFSQGAILTSHCFYGLNFSPAGLLLYSSALVAESTFPTLPNELKPPFIQTHGRRDEVLPISGALKLFDKLNQMGLKGKWLEFPGGHEIPMKVIEESQTFVNSLLKD